MPEDEVQLEVITTFVWTKHNGVWSLVIKILQINSILFTQQL